MNPVNPFKSATEMGRQLRIPSVLSPLLWVLPFFVSAFVVVSFTDNILAQDFLMWSIIAILIVFLLSYIGILSFGNPKLLRSEHHFETMKFIETLGDEKHTMQVIDSSLVANNPDIPNPQNAKPAMLDTNSK